MKKYLRLIFILTLLYSNKCNSQTIYSQNFGTSTSFPAGWSSNSVGSQVVNDNGGVNSSGYTFPATPGPTVAASGNANIMFRDCNSSNNANVTLTFNGISTIGKTNLILYFGRRETSTFGNAVKLEASTNGGGSFATISNDVRQSPIAATPTWTAANYSLPASLENSANLIFRFSYIPTGMGGCTSGSGNFRIDDFNLGSNGVLPVKLVRFKAETLPNSIELKWETAEEINVNRYEIERSDDAKEFYKINTILAKNQAENYSLIDNDPQEGINYYRLKIIDNDEVYEYSKIISAQYSADSQLFSLIQNPVRNTEIRFVCHNYFIENLRFMSITGQNILFELSQESSFFHLKPLHEIASGLYFLSVYDKKASKTLRVFIE